MYCRDAKHCRVFEVKVLKILVTGNSKFYILN